MTRLRSNHGKIAGLLKNLRGRLLLLLFNDVIEMLKHLLGDVPVLNMIDDVLHVFLLFGLLLDLLRGGLLLSLGDFSLLNGLIDSVLHFHDLLSHFELLFEHVSHSLG